MKHQKNNPVGRQASIRNITLDAFQHCPNLVHGFSPRWFETPEGRREELRVGRDSMPEVSSDHRRWLLQSMDLETDDLFLLTQVHGNTVCVLDNPDTGTEEVAEREADALVTHLPRRAIGVMTADCVPVLLHDPVKRIVGVVHAGRKGTEKSILAETIATLARVYGCRVEHLLVGFGPAIGDCCYELDAESIEVFAAAFQDGARFVRRTAGGRYYLDLFAANTTEARRAGVPESNIHALGECTACDNDRWYSYRREGRTGRIITVAALRD